MNQELFQQYLDNTCTEEEAATVENWLRTCDQHELDRLLLERWNATPAPMPSEQARQLWQQLHNAIDIAEPVVHRSLSRFYKRMIVAAAAVLLFAIACLFWISGKKEPLRTSLHPSATIPVVVKNVQWINVENTGNFQKKLTLEDGSVVLLEKSSVLKYPSAFAQQRNIYLTGKALFKVAKDAQHPFTVFSNNVSTTALGTVFSVNAKSRNSNIIIKLFEGKIIVRSIDEHKRDSMVLHPGETLLYDVRKGTMQRSVSSPATTTVHAGGNKYETTEAEMTFTNMALPDVLDTLVHYYKQPIEYNKVSIEGMYFTGVVSKKDPLSVVLDIISRMNGLQLDRSNGKYKLKRLPQ